MSPKEKAKDLFEKFLKTDKKDNYSFVGNEVAKECALIAIDEIFEAINWHELEPPNKEWDYWNDVKIEVERF
jgi:hypothetical protein